MSLLEKAKQAAQKADNEQIRAKEAEISAAKYLQECLTKSSKAILEGLKEFHNAKTNKGTLKLVRNKQPTAGQHGNTLATLRLTHRPSEVEDLDLLYVDAVIESGTRDYADDCRNIPYTEAVVRIYVKNPPTDERFSYAPTCNGAVKALGLKTYFSLHITNWDEKEIPKKLEEVADWLVPLFRET